MNAVVLHHDPVPVAVFIHDMRVPAVVAFFPLVHPHHCISSPIHSLTNERRIDQLRRLVPAIPVPHSSHHVVVNAVSAHHRLLLRACDQWQGITGEDKVVLDVTCGEKDDGTADVAEGLSVACEACKEGLNGGQIWEVGGNVLPFPLVHTTGNFVLGNEWPV